MIDRGLVERAVEAATTAYRSVVEIPEGTLGLVLSVYFDGDAPSQLTPPPVTIPRAKLDWCAAHGRLGDLWLPWDPPEACGEALRDPDVGDDADLKALLAEINDGGYEAGLLEDYLAALGVALHDALGVLVVIEGLDVECGAALSTQLRAQMPDAQWAEWEANDWLPRDRSIDRLLESLDIVVSVRIDRDQIAAVYVDDDGLHATGRLSAHRSAKPLSRPVQLVGTDPAVLAGVLPDGAVSVAVQDLYDEWRGALTARGAWLCVLPHQDRGPTPPVVFRAADGRELVPREAEPDAPDIRLVASAERADPVAWRVEQRDEERRVLEAAADLLLWPPGAGAPTLNGWSNDGRSGVELSGAGIVVHVARDGLFLELEDLLEEQLPLVLRDERLIARTVLEATPATLPARVDGRRMTFNVLAAGGAWAAMHGHAIAAGGVGPLPEELVLERISPGDVASDW